MDIVILAVGKMKDTELSLKAKDFSARIAHDARLSVEQIKDATPEREGEQLLARIGKKTGYVFALSENGALYTSKQFSAKLHAVGPRVYFIIGGPFGLSPAVRQAADEVLSLSPMTFPHEFARVMLLEQLYRAISIHHNRKYHK